MASDIELQRDEPGKAVDGLPPRSADEDTEREARDAAADTGPLRGGRVLAIDDNADIRESLAVVIRLLGHEVVTAADGESGLDEGRRFGPDVVLMDVGLPGLDGYAVARLMRQEAWGRRAYLVAMTGWTAASDRRAAEAAGFDAHVAKPVELRRLRELIATGCTDAGRAAQD